MLRCVTSISPRVTAASRGRGRPRDAEVHNRILRAATDVFISGGWRSFTFDAVARAAGVGKSTLYLRYADRAMMMREVMAANQLRIEPLDDANLHTELLAFAMAYAESLDGPAGMFNLRLMTESKLSADLRFLESEATKDVVAAAHDIIRRARQRGELPATASAAVLLDSLLGGLIHHLISARREPGTTYSQATGQLFVRRLVRAAIAGACAPS